MEECIEKITESMDNIEPKAPAVTVEINEPITDQDSGNDGKGSMDSTSTGNIKIQKPDMGGRKSM